MSKFVCDFQNHVAESVRLDPFHCVHHAGPHRSLVAEHLVLPLIEAAEKDGRAMLIARRDHSPDAPHVTIAQRTVRIQSGVQRSFITRHAPLQIERERTDAVRDVIGDLRNERVSVCFRVKSRAVAIFKRCIDHAHVQQQPFGLCAGISHRAVEMPTSIDD